MTYFVLTHRDEMCNPSSPSEGLAPAITAILLRIQIPNIHIQYEYSVLVSTTPFHCYSGHITIASQIFSKTASLYNMP
jgi:hypothetical protein